MGVINAAEVLGHARDLVSMLVSDIEATKTQRRVMEDLIALAARPGQPTDAAAPAPAPKIPTFGLDIMISDVRGRGTTFGTVWRWGEPNPRRGGEQGRISAAHCVEEWPGGAGWQPGMDRSQWPDFTKQYDDDEIILRPGGLDVVLFGVVLPQHRPPAMHEGMEMALRGYPAGVTIRGHYETRRAKAYLDRPEEFRGGEAPSWIMLQPLVDDPKTAARDNVIVIGGMSGGCGSMTLPRAQPGAVRTKSGWELPVALLVTLNGPMPSGEKSSDVVELADVWDEVTAMQAAA